MIRPIRVAVDRAAAASAPEIAYVIRTLLKAAGYSWVIDWADALTGPVDIAYGDAAWGRASVRIPYAGWEYRSAPSRNATSALDYSDITLLQFAGEKRSIAALEQGRLNFPVDALFGCYWWLTGAAEAGYPRDRHDNLNLDGTVVLSEGLLSRPCVSMVAALLRNHLESEGRPARMPAWVAGSARAAFCLTSDVDYPEIIRWIEVPRLLGARGIGGARLALDVARGRSHFWTFREWVDFAAGLGTRPAFYFMARKGSLVRYALGTPDDFYDIGSPRFALLFDELRRRGCEIGLHASYRAYRDSQQLRRERECLEFLAGVSAVGNRHHYWHLDPDDPNETLRRHEDAGLAYDSSLGLEFYPGFRRGICHPFRVYHAGERRELDVVQLPPAWMDDHFDRRLSRNHIANPEAAAGALLDIASAAGGVVIVDYHSRGMNSRFFPRYGPWLERFAESRLDGSFSYNTPLEILASYIEHEQQLMKDSSERLVTKATTLNLRHSISPAEGLPRIRRATPLDSRAIAKVYVAAFPELRLSRFGASFAAEYFRLLLSTPRSIGVVAEIADGTFQGFAIGYVGTSRGMRARLVRRSAGLVRHAIVSLLRRPALVLDLGRGVAAHGSRLPPDCDALLVSIAVSGSERGRRIGARLLVSFVDQARARGATKLALEVDQERTSAVSLYESVGFQRVGRLTSPSFAPIYMELDLRLVGTAST